jgi:hypothetical protein
MMPLNDGTELLFKINAEPYSIEGWTEGISLKYLETDESGLKMGGDFPILWESSDQKIVGPELYDDDHQYKVVNVDYDNALIWLLNY